MFQRCLKNNVIRSQLGYSCCLCNYETCTTTFNIIEQHLNSNTHKQKFDNTGTIALKEQSWNLIFDEISETQRKELVDNYITLDYKAKQICNFQCHICHCLIPSLIHAFQHIRGKNHVATVKEREKLMANVNAAVDQQTKNQYPFFTFSKHNAYCTICDRYIAFKELDNHILNESHQTIEKECSANDTVVNDQSWSGAVENFFDDIRYCTPCQYEIDNDVSYRCHAMIHIYIELNHSKNDIIQCQTDKNGDVVIKCLLCNLIVPNPLDFDKHVQSKNHLKLLSLFDMVKVNLSQNLPFKNNIDNIALPSQEYGIIESRVAADMIKTSYCKLCKMHCMENSEKDHILSKQHLINLNTSKSGYKTKYKITDQYITCFICQISFSSLKHLIKHYFTDSHRYRMNCLQTINQNPSIKIIKNSFICTLCQVNPGNCTSVMQHIMGKGHKSQEKIFPQSEKPQVESNNKINEAVGFNNNISVIEAEHLNVKKEPKPEINTANDFSKIDHSNKSQIIPKTNNESSQLQYSSENLDLNEVLDNLMESDLKKLRGKIQPVIKKERDSVEITKAQQIHCEKALQFGKKYIQMCIEPGPQNIYNLDDEQIRLLKLGTRLMFPLKLQQLCFPCGKQLPKDNNLIYEHLQDPAHIEIVCELEENDRAFKDFPNQFSDLRLAKQYMVQANQGDKDSSVYCYACNLKMKDDNFVINAHIEMPVHVATTQAWTKSSEELSDEFLKILENSWYYSQVFLCEFCKFKTNFEIDFIAHLQSSQHYHKLTKLYQKNTYTKFDFCSVCTTGWYGKIEAHKLHCESMVHRRFANSGDMTVPMMPPITVDLLKNVDTKILSLIDESNKVNLEKKNERELLVAVQDTVKDVYPDARAYVFGSRLSNLGLPNSDTDIFLDCHNKYYQISNKTEAQEIVLRVADLFKAKPNLWIIDETLIDTRVPILKVRYIPNSMKCDLSFTNGLSVEKSTLVGDYNKVYPICRWLILYLKKWSTTCKLSGFECITTFAMSWLVIFYLQTKGILPSVYDLISLKNKSKIVDGWECGFLSSIPTTFSNLNFKDHLKGFFKFYANYDYRMNVLVPYTGVSVKKSFFASPEDLPREFNLYKQRLEISKLFLFRFDSPMCIQDPLDLSQNMTKAVNKLQLRCFKQYCKESYQLIENL